MSHHEIALLAVVAAGVALRAHGRSAGVRHGKPLMCACGNLAVGRRNGPVCARCRAIEDAGGVGFERYGRCGVPEPAQPADHLGGHYYTKRSEWWSERGTP